MIVDRYMRSDLFIVFSYRRMYRQIICVCVWCFFSIIAVFIESMQLHSENEHERVYDFVNVFGYKLMCEYTTHTYHMYYAYSCELITLYEWLSWRVFEWIDLFVTVSNLSTTESHTHTQRDGSESKIRARMICSDM